VIADGDRILRESLVFFLSARGFNVVGAAENGRRAVLLARQRRPDVIMLAVTMAVMGGLDAAKLILQMNPNAAILFLTGYAEDNVVIQGLRVGVHGFVVKAQGLDDLVQVIRDVAAGAIYVSAMYSRGVLQAFAPSPEAVGPRLSDREWQMLRLIAESKSTKQAAAAMAVSARTAESHRAKLMDKLGIHDTAGLVRYAIRQGVIVA
jgi:DNA-binding NarL/FixJ family response regulator